VGEHAQHLSDAVAAEIDSIWHEEITDRFGIENYQAMILALD